MFIDIESVFLFLLKMNLNKLL